MPGGAVFGLETAAARRYVELVNKIFGMESGDAPLPPGFLLEIDRPEWAFLKRELFWSTGDITIPAAVGNVSRLQIHNPPVTSGSGRIVVVEGFTVVNPPIGNVYVVTRDGALAGTPTANLALDTRVPPAAASRKVGSLNRIDNALPGSSGERLDGRLSDAAGRDLIFNWRVGPMHPITLVPNSVCEVVCLTQNLALRAIGFGYERPATPDELAL